ncbi:MAG: CBS domain-containing protein [Lachnospiraceae bacterium]
MNILFFLIPKENITYIYEDETLRQVIEKMENHRFSCVPIIDRAGQYVGSITEGDLLWGIKKLGSISLKDTEDISLKKIERRLDYGAIHVGAKMEDLLEKAMDQNFVPVVDDKKSFIGIITRKDIISHFTKTMCPEKEARE